MSNVSTADVRESAEDEFGYGDVSDHYSLFTVIDDIAKDEGLE